MTAGPRAAGALAVLAALGCAESPTKRAGNPADVAGALARREVVPARPANLGGRPLAFLVLGGSRGPRLGAYDLADSRLLWTQPAEVTARLAVGTDILVHGVKGAVVGRDIATGVVRWTHALGASQRLMGYAIDRDVTYLVTQTRGATRAEGTAVVQALAARDGDVRWTHALPSADAAGPAAGGGLVAVPLQSQYVALLDGRTGDQVAMVLSSEEAATFVRALPEGMFYGSRGVFRLEPGTAAGSRRSSGYLHPTLPGFVRPFYATDFYRPEQADYSAIDRNRIVWRVAEGGDRARFRDDLAFVHHFRFFFAFDARDGRLRWAYSHPSTEAVASDHTGAALVFVTADGELGALDARTGRRIYTARLPGEVVRGAPCAAEGFAPASGGAAAPPSLAATLSSIVWDPDRRFSDVKLFAIEELARQPGREVTAELLKVMQQEGLAPAAYEKAGAALIARQDTSAGDLLAEALRGHDDYAENRTRPPVEILARAAGAMRATAAAPALAEHLLRPETEPAAIVQIARALGAIGAVESVPALRDFATMYRAEPAYDGDPAALVAVTEALLALGGPAERQLLLFLAEEPRTVEPLRRHLRYALAGAGTATSLLEPGAGGD